MADLIPELLRAEARFALKTIEERSALPHSEAMRVPIGGLRGLSVALDPQAEVPKTVDETSRPSSRPSSPARAA